MRTRTLLLLAVACGLVILTAGVVLLLRLAAEDDAAEPLHTVGETVTVGDLRVHVSTYRETAEAAHIEVRLGGVNDPDGSDTFRLVVSGAAEPLRAVRNAADACGATAVAARTCTLTFPLDDPAGGQRVLVYQRGDVVARWGLGQ